MRIYAYIYIERDWVYIFIYMCLHLCVTIKKEKRPWIWKVSREMGFGGKLGREEMMEWYFKFENKMWKKYCIKLCDILLISLKHLIINKLLYRFMFSACTT